MSSKRYLLSFLLMLSCVCAAWSQENKQGEIPLVFSEGVHVVIDPGWVIWGSATPEVIQEGVGAGSYCLHITTQKGEEPSDAQLIHKGHVFRKGKVYTLAAYLKSPDKLQINLRLQLAEEPWTGYGGQSFTMTETWQEYHVTTPPMPEDVSPAELVFHFAYGTGEFYIDNVRFYEGEYVPYKPEGMGQIEGRLMMLDDETPQVAVPVQLINNGEVIATTLSDDKGMYRFMILRPGKYQLRCQVLGGYVYCGKEKAREPEDQKAGQPESRMTSDEPITLQVEGGSTLEDIDFRFAPLKRGTWRIYNFLDGLAGNYVCSIYGDPDGVMWFGTGGGLSRYDGQEFRNFTTKDGLANDWVNALYTDSEGVMWLGTQNGVSRYDGETFTNLTMEDGLVDNVVYSIVGAPDGTIWFGTGMYGQPGGGASRYDGREFKNFTTEDGLANNNIWSIECTPDGMVWFTTWCGGVSRYDGKEFRTFTTKDGLAGNCLLSVHSDRNGGIWVGTYRKGLSWYNGVEFVTFTTRDGLADNSVRAIHSDADGVMWFGTDGGLSRYDGKTFVNFTQKDGLASNWVYAIHRAPDGVLWFGTEGGVSRYDSRGMGDSPRFVNFTTKDGLAGNSVGAIYQDPDGILWFGAFVWPAGVSRYDGKEFATLGKGNVMSIESAPDGTLWFGGADGVYRYNGKWLTNLGLEDGLPNVWVDTVYRTPDNTLWVGTSSGAARYDGQKFTSFTTQDGLPDNYINCIHGDPDETLWFGTDAGVSRYDGRKFENFSAEDGLAGHSVLSIHRDTDGIMWFGTASGGVSLYDGTVWTSIDKRDGLAGNMVLSIHEETDGSLLFATEGGITIYRRNTRPPSARIVSVRVDKEYTDLQSIPDITTGRRVTIKYSSIDFVTVPEKRLYRYRVYETGDVRLETSDMRHGTSDREVESQVSSLKSDVPYNPPNRNTTFDWTPKKPGTYTFQVRAIDRDLNYSEPANLTLRVVPPFYLRAAFLIPTIGSGAIVLAIVGFLATALTRRRRQVHAYQQLAVRELRDARDMQMALLPEAAPPVEGMEIAGRSIPANTVGGDFFDYITLADGKVGIAMADISGKGLRAAMNAVMTSGMLYEVVKTEMSCGNILSALNAGLHPRMEKQTFAAFSFAILDQNAGVIQWSNAAQPLPLIKRSDGVSEAEEGGGLPLGMAPDVRYPDHQLKLQTGDMVILYTDGIIEAENEAEEMYGTERLLNFVAGIDSAAGAEDVMEAILQDVARFTGDAERYDDMTVVVVKKYL